ncbi:MAG: hypothetical protein E6552_01480 [Sutterella wadsworthensis]|nr:hypothetical protein [Sutterella wadsworthensis]
MIKNLEKSTVIKLKDQVPYLAGQVVSKTLAQNDSLSKRSSLSIKEKKSARISPAATRW